MKRQTIYIPEYDWTVYVYYGTTPRDTQEILSKICRLGCPKEGILRSRKQLLSGDYNNGLTYSNRVLKQSVVSLGMASEFAQFLNSFVHELHHLVTHIASAEGIPLEGEEICYLSGDIAQEMYPILMYYISNCKLL